MSSTPFLDLTAIRTLLSGLVTAGTVRDLRILGSQQRAVAGLVVWACPGIAIIPGSSTVSGQQGLGNGRILSERIEIVIQIEQMLADDGSAAASLSSIRAAVFAALEGHRPLPLWSPLRYQGGQLFAIDNAVYTWVDSYQTQASVVSI